MSHAINVTCQIQSQLIDGNFNISLLQVLRVLFSSVIRLSREEQRLLQKDLVLLVSRFAIPPELISTAVDIATVGEQLISPYLHFVLHLIFMAVSY